MKRYAHAWIAIRAIDRLRAYAEQIKTKESEKSECILYFADLLTSKIQLVVEGAWLPDNVIRDNRPGHIWKYSPPLNAVDVKYARKDHAESLSLCFQEAENTNSWEKPWNKTSGYLVYRCIAVQQMMRDMILYQRDEMHRLAATILVRFNDDLSDSTEVVRFLGNPAAVKEFYDKQDEAKQHYVNRDKVIALYNSIGVKKEVGTKVKKALGEYGDDIKRYINHDNALRMGADSSIFFPLFYTDDQIALTFFTLAHYVADAHMPLHCDARDFSNEECGNIHGCVEERWENWVIEKKEAAALTKSLSESKRAERFIGLIFKDDSRTWDKYTYPDDSLLRDFDKQFGQKIWGDRALTTYVGDVWDDITGITYASYCLAGRLIRFNDAYRGIPSGSKDTYEWNYSGQIVEVTKANWEEYIDGTDLDKGFKQPKAKAKKLLNETRKEVYYWVKARETDPTFSYLSLLILIDSVEAVSRLWADTILEHLEIAFSKRLNS